MKKNKTKIMIIILILFIASTLTTQAKTIKVKINASGATITKDFNGVKLTVKTPKISKNKYLRLVNIGF